MWEEGFLALEGGGLRRSEYTVFIGRPGRIRTLGKPRPRWGILLI